MLALNTYPGSPMNPDSAAILVAAFNFVYAVGSAAGKLQKGNRPGRCIAAGTPAGYRLWAVVCLGGRRPAPERTGIGSISMKLHHPVEEFAHGRRLLVEA